MPQWWFDWSGWIFGLIGALGVIITWIGLSQRVTRNTVKGGDRNDLAGGKGSTTNIVETGNDNTLRG